MNALVLKDARTPGSAEAVADDILAGLSIDWEALIALLVPELLAEGKLGVQDIISRLGLEDVVSFDEVAPEVQRYADTRAAELVGMHRTADGRYVPSERPGIAITDSTREMLRATVQRAIEEGSTAAEIRHEIIESYGFSPARALCIARTETAFARNQGALIAAKQSGVVLGKKWELGEEACELCEANAAQGQVGLDGVFQSGDEAPPAHPNCRCSLGYVLAENSP